MKFFLCPFGILWNIWSSTKWSNNLCIISCDCETVHISKCIVSGLQQPTKPLATVLISYHPSPNSLDLLLQIRIHAFCRSRCMLFANFFLQIHVCGAFQCLFCLWDFGKSCIWYQIKRQSHFINLLCLRLGVYLF